MSDENEEVERILGGLEFMAVRMNVALKKRELAAKKLITPSEYYLIDEIELGTIAAANKKKQICSKAPFDLDYLASQMGISLNHLYNHLKSAYLKKFIVREQTQFKKLEILGLNPEVFGQILIDKYHEKEVKNQLHLAVDNSQNSVDNSKGQVQNLYQVSTEVVPNKYRSCTNQVQKLYQTQPQVVENIEQKIVLESSRVYLESFRGKNFKNFFGQKSEKPEREIIEENHQKFKIQKKYLDETDGKIPFEKWKLEKGYAV